MKHLSGLGLLIALVVSLLAVGYFWNLRPDTLFGPAPDLPQTSREIDFYGEKVFATQYLIDGRLKYEMSAPYLEHVKETDTAYVTQPDLLLFRGTPYPWHVQSRTAEVLPDGKQVELIDDARVARTDARDRPTIVTSTRMTVFPPKQYAESSQPVKIETANGVTTGVGMKAYLQEEKVYLQSNVRGHYEVKH